MLISSRLHTIQLHNYYFINNNNYNKNNNVITEKRFIKSKLSVIFSRGLNYPCRVCRFI